MKHDHSRWGAEDQRGAMNLVTPEVTLAAMQSVQTGRMFDLSHDIQRGHPMMEPVQSPFIISLLATADSARRMIKSENDMGVFTERVEMGMHTGTHVDALGHITIGDEMYNGLDYREHSSGYGLDRLGIEHMPPMVTRGVCIDLSSLDGGDFLEGGRVISRDELKSALDAAGVGLQPGDAIFLRTGWGRHFMVDNARYIASEPGIDVEAAQWLTRQDVCAVGCDNMAVEVMPNPNPRRILPVHQHALVEAGVHLVENLVLDELAAEGINTFCLMMLPVKFAGATASPVRPVAVV